MRVEDIAQLVKGAELVTCEARLASVQIPVGIVFSYFPRCHHFYSDKKSTSEITLRRTQIFLVNRVMPRSVTNQNRTNFVICRSLTIQGRKSKFKSWQIFGSSSLPKAAPSCIDPIVGTSLSLAGSKVTYLQKLHCLYAS